LTGQINSLYRSIRDDVESFLLNMGCDESMLHMADSRVSMALPEEVKRKSVELDDCKSDSGTEEDNEEIVKAFETEVRTFLNQSLGTFNNDFIVNIEISSSQHWLFVSRCIDIKLPRLKGLYIGYYSNSQKKKHDYDQTFVLLNKRKQSKFQLFRAGMVNLMSAITKEVYIDLFVMDNNSLKYILESCHNVKKLTLRGCEVNINRSFSIKLSLHYTIKEINLFGTCDIKDANYITEDKLEIFAAVLANTSLRNSVSIVRVCETSFPSEIAQKIFNK
jgi:hypothetical protein